MQSAKPRERAYYVAAIDAFLTTDADQVLGRVTSSREFSVDRAQRDAKGGPCASQAYGTRATRQLRYQSRM